MRSRPLGGDLYRMITCLSDLAGACAIDFQPLQDAAQRRALLAGKPRVRCARSCVRTFSVSMPY